MGVLPYALLAFAMAAIGRSTALGAAGIILFLIVESSVVPILGALPSPWEDIRNLTIGYNAAALLAANRIDDSQYLSLAFRETPDAADLPNAWLAFTILCGWCAALLSLTYYVFSKRDLRLGTGE
jgi:ABC-type transport system involved in multi-copper enzyme maturation permease subunit